MSAPTLSEIESCERLSRELHKRSGDAAWRVTAVYRRQDGTFWEATYAEGDDGVRQVIGIVQVMPQAVTVYRRAE